MIAKIIKLCQTLPFYGAGEYTEIAKGKNEIVLNWKQVAEQVKRAYKK